MQRFCLILIIQKINDTYGHACGDQVLRIVAQRCRSSIRDTDILGRYGGEEFALLLPDTDAEVAWGVAERLRHDISATPIITEHGLITVTISVGVATAAGDDLEVGNLLDQADTALYIAKRTGRNRVVQASQCSTLVAGVER